MKLLGAYLYEMGRAYPGQLRESGFFSGFKSWGTKDDFKSSNNQKQENDS